MKKLSEVKHPTRKRLWWLIFLVPILYVVVDNLIYPIDESKILRRTTHVIVQPEAAMDEESSTQSLPTEDSTLVEISGESLTGWEIYDMVWARVEKAWPLVLSFLTFYYRRKLVGDPK